MKATIFAALTLATLAGPPNVALAQTGEPSSELPVMIESASEQADKALAVALWKIAVATRTRIGFQSVEAIDTVGGVFGNAPAATTASLDEALNAALARNPRYEWRRVGEFVVVRPTGAWSDAADPFNRPVHHFRAEGTNEARVLSGISNLVHTGLYEVRSGSGTPVAIAVEAGTLIDVMNRLAESADIAFWQVGYKPHPYEQRLSRYDLDLTLVNDMNVRAASFTHTPSNRASRSSGN